MCLQGKLLKNIEKRYLYRRNEIYLGKVYSDKHLNQGRSSRISYIQRNQIGRIPFAKAPEVVDIDFLFKFYKTLT
jgi:hypothetical protein